MKHGIRAYQKTAALAQRRREEELVRQYAPLVKRVAYRIVHRLPASVEVEDLISVGTIGLLQAISSFDDSKGTRFESFAEFRIKGAMLDELRTYDFMSRTARQKLNKIQRAIEQFEQAHTRQPTPGEVAAETGLKLKNVERLMAENQQLAFLTLEDLGVLPASQTESASELLVQGRPDDPFGSVFMKQLREELQRALEEMPERLKLVMSLYYHDELNFKEIGQVLDLTESRISQLHGQAVAWLRKRLAKAT